MHSSDIARHTGRQRERSRNGTWRATGSVARRRAPIGLPARVAGVAILVAVVTHVDFVLARSVDAAFFYFMPIVLAVVWFGMRGTVLVPVAVALYHWNQVALTPPVGEYSLGNTGVKMLSFSLIAGLTLFARARYYRSQEAERLAQTLRQAAEARGDRLEALYRLASGANTSREPDEILRTLLGEMTRLVPHIQVATALVREGDWLVRRAAQGPLPEGVIAERVRVGDGIAGRATASGQPLIVPEGCLNLNDIASEAIRRTRPSSAAALPLMHQGEALGVVVLFGEAGVQFSDEDMRTLLSMAAEAALVLHDVRLTERLRHLYATLEERQRLLDDQLRLAREVQSAIVAVGPDYRRTGRLEIASFYASAWEVGGDILRIVPGEDGTALFVGDVMGKGVPAALLMTMVTAALGGPAVPADEPASVLHETNQVLTRNLVGFMGFATVFYAYIRDTDLSMRYACAGHLPAILAHADGSEELLSAHGLPLGIERDAGYAEGRCALRSGDRLVLYSDGVPDARNAAREFFGADRLREIVSTNRAKSARELREAIVSAVAEFTGERAPADDMALLVVAVGAGQQEHRPGADARAVSPGAAVGQPRDVMLIPTALRGPRRAGRTPP